MKKYEITYYWKIVGGVELHQIRALKDFGNVKAGDLGGWIKKESNLSQNGTAWISDDAIVRDNAVIEGNAIISGEAFIGGNAIVKDNAQVKEKAWVCHNAMVKGNAVVEGKSIVYGSAIVEGNVSGNASVSGNAWVEKYARVNGNAYIKRKTDTLVVGPLTDVDDCTTFFKNKEGGTSVVCSCFSGSLEDFLIKCGKDHKRDVQKYRSGEISSSELFNIALEYC